MRISDWSSDGCSSDLVGVLERAERRDRRQPNEPDPGNAGEGNGSSQVSSPSIRPSLHRPLEGGVGWPTAFHVALQCKARLRWEGHTSELQALMRISYAVFCLKKKTIKNNTR